MEKKYKVRFTYFKPSGKYYSEGEGVLPPDFWLKRGDRRDQIIEHNGGMPGLSSRAEHFFIIMEWIEDHNQAFPMMIRPEVGPDRW
jgi:hypothetical protein